MDLTTPEVAEHPDVLRNMSRYTLGLLPSEPPVGDMNNEDSDTNTSITQSPTNSEKLTDILQESQDTKALQEKYLQNIYALTQNQLFKNVEDYSFYNLNREKFQRDKQTIVGVMRKRRHVLNKKIKRLQSHWKQVLGRWEENIARVDRLTEIDKTKNAKKSEPFIKRSTRKVMSNFTAGDIVRSEEEFLEILAKLEQQEKEASNVSEASRIATIPPMILSEEEVKSQYFNDQSRLVTDCPKFYHFQSMPDIWNEEQHSIFVQQFILHGKKFGKIAEAVPGKNSKECVLHYYLTKRTTDYRALVASATKTKGRRRKKLLPSQRGGKKKSKGSALMVDIEAADINKTEENINNQFQEASVTADNMNTWDNTPSVENVESANENVNNHNADEQMDEKIKSLVEGNSAYEIEKGAQEPDPMSIDMTDKSETVSGFKHDVDVYGTAENEGNNTLLQIKESVHEKTPTQDEPMDISQDTIKQEDYYEPKLEQHSSSKRNSISTRKEEDAASALANLSAVGRSISAVDESAHQGHLPGWDEKEEALIFSLAQGMNPMKMPLTPRRASTGPRPRPTFQLTEIDSPNRRRASDCITPSISKILKMVSEDAKSQCIDELSVEDQEHTTHSSHTTSDINAFPNSQSFPRASIHTLAALGEDIVERQSKNDKIV
ncbi:Set3 complex subunit Snt1 [Schizosaccharomyces pombe]